MPTVQAVAFFSLIPLLCATWIYRVNKAVSEPYLDEVFHARQAQAYCAGKFRTWDPKITTPPGLYILSYVLLKPTFLIYGRDFCHLLNLRLLNSLAASLVIPVQVWDIYNYVGVSRPHGRHDRDSFHSVMNICLFPLLFFFSGLYYTDVCSVSVVLGAYEYHLRSLRGASAWKNRDAAKMFGLGLCAIWMRQTNIFWAAVFLAGLHAVDHLKRTNSALSKESVDLPGRSQAIYDPPISEAYIEDYTETAFSLAKSALTHPASLLLGLWPYLGLLASFAVFVLQNGGVVLGDKANHIASLHIPQMLYVWPYIIFFSWPVVLPQTIHILFADVRPLSAKLPRPMVAVPMMAMMALAVHLNTIVHPFTLADNRHYVFYVFRILLRNALLKYAAVVVYFICGWAAIAALSNGATPTETRSDKATDGISKAASPEKQVNSRPTRISFLLVYLSSTALSVITAPLVEPRYFILPWLIWRLHVEPPPPSRSSSPITPARRLLGPILRADKSTWLYLETFWFLLVNLGACWLFLYRGFEWVQDPGKVQRFMW